MKRIALKKLKEWKERTDKKPLIIHGARQVGKTWLIKEFGKMEYKNVAYIMFEKNERMKNLFLQDMDISRILMGLEIETKQKINPVDTLIIFDEIQECPNALTSLKYFSENVPEYNFIAAGSLLGVFLHTGVSFPVGKVEFMDLYPMNFYEFLFAIGEEKLCALLDKNDFNLISIFKDNFISYLRMYFYVGGMPEVVLKFSKNKDFRLARTIQNQILESYIQDFSKHIPSSNIGKVTQLWNSIPAQLAKENKKFVYKEVQKGANANTYELSLEWLIRCGLVHRIPRVSKPTIPLKAYENNKAFKLFLSDIGLLSTLSKLDVRTLLEGKALFTEFRGALTEQFVLQELKVIQDMDMDIAYWANEAPATAEVDFVLQYGSNIVPIEVKSSINLKSKSLKIYQEKFQPRLSIRSSLADFKKIDNLYDIPLYALGQLLEIMKI
ncbi:MAG: ATP-binding protein [Endomicrobium sp.]|jgi:predicted AAA+ superfamily ATPase|nr:ATP-binding protein [Endomicrobium sp.]